MPQINAAITAHAAIGAAVHKGIHEVPVTPEVKSSDVDADGKVTVEYTNGGEVSVESVPKVVSKNQAYALFLANYEKAGLALSDWNADDINYSLENLFNHLLVNTFQIAVYCSPFSSNASARVAYLHTPLSQSKLQYGGVTCAHSEAACIYGFYHHQQIPEYFFADCANLYHADAVDYFDLRKISNYMFYNCPKFGSANSALAIPARTTLPGASIIGIGKYAFAGCISFALSELNPRIKTIGDFAFASLIRTNNTASGGNMLVKLTELPTSLTTIGAGAFFKCTSLAITQIPIGVTELNWGAFALCTGLTSINAPGVSTVAGTTTVMAENNSGWGAFYRDTGLKEVTLGSMGHPVTSIGRYAFYGCTALQKLKIYTAGTLVTTYAPWGASNASIEYYSSTTGELL